MATPSGTIGLSDVNIELGFAGTTLITMNQANVRTLAGVPSGAISMQNLQGKSNRVTSNITISSNTSNYVLNTAKVTGYSSGKTDATLTINPSIFISSGSTGSYALQVDTSWAVGDTVTIVNNGTIVGRGGNGGNGELPARSTGAPAGPALLVQRAITMNNLNRIAGGGGGGGGSSANYVTGPGKAVTIYGGGGGGGGIGGGSGGNGGSPGGQNGGTGSLTSAGGGGSGPGGNGAAGGGYGSGGSGGGATPTASGGAAGACIVGNSNITYTNTGTRNGSIS